jgi:hypothetical protein
MQAPIMVFDHVAKQVLTLATGPAADKRLEKVLASQRSQVATSGRPGH